MPKKGSNSISDEKSENNDNIIKQTFDEANSLVGHTIDSAENIIKETANTVNISGKHLKYLEGFIKMHQNI